MAADKTQKAGLPPAGANGMSVMGKERTHACPAIRGPLVTFGNQSGNQAGGILHPGRHAGHGCHHDLGPLPLHNITTPVQMCDHATICRTWRDRILNRPAGAPFQIPQANLGRNSALPRLARFYTYLVFWAVPFKTASRICSICGTKAPAPRSYCSMSGAGSRSALIMPMPSA